MCDVCKNMFGHFPGCPNEPEIIWGICDKCRGEIYEGDQYIDTGLTVCGECLDEMTSTELLTLLGYELKKAGSE